MTTDYQFTTNDNKILNEALLTLYQAKI